MSSFRKRNVQKPIPGTRTSPKTGQVITSSGNPSMDAILGGGLAIGSICLIEEDRSVTHSKVLAKYFLAEGILSEQTIFLGSLDDDPNELLRKLPKPIDEEEEEEKLMSGERSPAKDCKDTLPNNGGLRIAWRYTDLPMVNSEQCDTKIGHHFNLLEQMDPKLLDYREIVVWHDEPIRHGGGDTFSIIDEERAITWPMDDAEDECSAINAIENDTTAEIESKDNDVMANAAGTASTIANGTETSVRSSSMIADAEITTQQKIFDNGKYWRILSQINEQLRQDKFNPTAAVSHYQKSLCRICITSLASPLWYETQFAEDLLKFMTLLRAVVRSSLAVCFITMPMHLVAKCDAALVPKVRNLVDYAIELESFAGCERETHPAYRDYNGLLHLHRISAINTLNAFVPPVSDLAFKLRRKKFVIEELHLPPELQDGDDQSGAVKMLNCGTNNNNNTTASSALDF